MRENIEGSELEIKISAAQSRVKNGTILERDLHGKRLDEALQEVDFFLNDPSIGEDYAVSIVWGIGKGILREGVLNHLRKNKEIDIKENETQTGCVVIFKK